MRQRGEECEAVILLTLNIEKQVKGLQRVKRNEKPIPFERLQKECILAGPSEITSDFQSRKRIGFRDFKLPGLCDLSQRPLDTDGHSPALCRRSLASLPHTISCHCTLSVIPLPSLSLNGGLCSVLMRLVHLGDRAHRSSLF